MALVLTEWITGKEVISFIQLGFPSEDDLREWTMDKGTFRSEFLKRLEGNFNPFEILMPEDE